MAGLRLKICTKRFVSTITYFSDFLPDFASSVNPSGVSSVEFWIDTCLTAGNEIKLRKLQWKMSHYTVGASEVDGSYLDRGGKRDDQLLRK